MNTFSDHPFALGLSVDTLTVIVGLDALTEKVLLNATRMVIEHQELLMPIQYTLDTGKVVESCTPEKLSRTGGWRN